MAAKKKKKVSGDTIAINRRARHDYQIDDTVEAGIVLTGTEVKALRDGRASLVHAYAAVRSGEVWLMQAHIAEYSHGNRFNHAPERARKLLLHRSEIAELERFTQEVGRTLVPMQMHWSGGRAKVLLGLASGKAQHDKRRDIAERDAKRQLDREFRARQKV